MTSRLEGTSSKKGSPLDGIQIDTLSEGKLMEVRVLETSLTSSVSHSSPRKTIY